MGKVLAIILILGAGALVWYWTGGTGGSEPEGVSEEEIEQVLQEEGSKRFVASCNAIAEKSSCVDYIGSFWADEDLAALNCQGVGKYSEEETCPYSEFGGCQTGAGTVTEMVIWAYREGPGEYDEESVPYAAAACNANPMAQWIMPDDLLKP
jgi:hypothetical protein